MDEILMVSGLDLEQFLRARITDEVQDVGIHRASTNKFDRAEEALLEDPEPAKRLVLALGRITSAVQSSSRDGSHLRSPERGIFVVRRRKEDDQDGVRMPMLREAVESGYLQFASKSTPTEWRFRLHTSLAPRFGCSYRGAYYPVVLTTRELNKLCYTEDPGEFEAEIIATIERIQGRPRPPGTELPLAVE
jgi:hypothetical protein